MFHDKVKGGFLRFKSNPKEKKYSSFDKIVKDTKKSETKLISSYEEMDKKTQDYTKAYADHIENLEILDDYAHFNGLITLFQKIIMKDNITPGKVIDKSSPIFFRNYMIEGEVSPQVLRTEHLKRQVDYLRSKFFSIGDNTFIDYNTITDITKTSFVVNVITIDKKKYNRKLGHDDFIVDKSDLKRIFKDILHTTKKNLRRNNKVITYNENTLNTYNTKSKSIPSSRKRKSSSRTIKINGNKHNNANNKSKKHISSQKHINLNLYANTNSKKGISKFNTNIQNILKKKSISMFNVNKTKSIWAKEAKAKKNAENVAKQQPITNEQLIDAKCKLFGENSEMCKLDQDCFFSTNANKCFKKTEQQKQQQAYVPQGGIPNPFAIPNKDMLNI